MYNTNTFKLTDEHYEIAEQNGISRKCAYGRVNDYSWSIEDAITRPVKKFKDRGDWLSIAEANGIKRETFYRRVNRLGWHVERAATEPALTRKEAARASAQKTRTVAIEDVQTAERNGICRSTLSTRMRAGWSLQDAISTPVLSRAEAGKRSATKRKARGDVGRIVFGKPRRNRLQMERYWKEKDTLTGKLRAQANAKKSREQYWVNKLQGGAK